MQWTVLYPDLIHLLLLVGKGEVKAIFPLKEALPHLSHSPFNSDVINHSTENNQNSQPFHNDVHLSSCRQRALIAKSQPLEAPAEQVRFTNFLEAVNMSNAKQSAGNHESC